MRRWLDRGVECLAEHEGQGRIAERGDRITWNARLFLHRGEEVTPDPGILERARRAVDVRVVSGIELIDHVSRLGRRDMIAGIEKALTGMRAGGWREVLIAPHLAYGADGVPGRIPPHALLRVELWLQTVHREDG